MNTSTICQRVATSVCLALGCVFSSCWQNLSAAEGGYKQVEPGDFNGAYYWNGLVGGIPVDVGPRGGLRF